MLTSFLVDEGTIGILGLLGGVSYIIYNLTLPENVTRTKTRHVLKADHVEVGEKAIVTYPNGERHRTEPVLFIAYEGNEVRYLYTEHMIYSVYEKLFGWGDN
jgi:hypothetical protein